MFTAYLAVSFIQITTDTLANMHTTRTKKERRYGTSPTACTSKHA
jgi:hypothetical protein